MSVCNYFMRSILMMGFLTGCSDTPPHGQWEATGSVDVYAEKFKVSKLAFEVQKGDICSLGDKWHADKDLSFKEVVCKKGRGWIINDENFKKISD